MWPVAYMLGVLTCFLAGGEYVRRTGPPPLTFVLPALFLGLVGLSYLNHGVGDEMKVYLCVLAGALALGGVWRAANTDWDE
jgi:hypothetical protein